MTVIAAFEEPTDSDVRSLVQVTETIEEIPVLELVEPMPGFPGQRRFALVRMDDAGVLCALCSLDDPDLRFLVVPPAAFFDDYFPVISDETVTALGIESPDDVLVLAVVNPGESAASATVNLLAPVLVNTGNRRAIQVILDDASLPVRAPLVP